MVREDKRRKPTKTGGAGNWLKKPFISIIERRDLLFLGVGLLLTAGFLLLFYLIFFGMRVAFDPILPTYDQFISATGATSLFDKITWFNYAEWNFLYLMIMGGAPAYLIVGIVGQWLLITVLFGLAIALASWGHLYRVALNMTLVFLVTQLILIWWNPSCSGIPGFEDLQSIASIMLLINFALTFGFAVIWNAILSRSLFKYTRQWENIDNKTWKAGKKA